MPNRPTAGGVFLPNYLNACNSPSSTGAQDPVTGDSLPTGLTPYKVWELSFSEAQSQQAPLPSIEQCYEGAYMWVQVDSSATAGDVQTGRAAFYKINAANNSVEPIATITSQDQATANTLWAGVFLNPITPGNWGVIFAGAGRVNVTFKSSLTNSGAIGDVVGVASGAAGLFDDTAATTTTALSVGIACVAPVANGTSPIYCRDLFYRI
jgi:hypothetical protein